LSCLAAADLSMLWPASRQFYKAHRGSYPEPHPVLPPSLILPRPLLFLLKMINDSPVTWELNLETVYVPSRDVLSPLEQKKYIQNYHPFYIDALEKKCREEVKASMSRKEFIGGKDLKNQDQTMASAFLEHMVEHFEHMSFRYTAYQITCMFINMQLVYGDNFRVDRTFQSGAVSSLTPVPSRRR